MDTTTTTPPVDTTADDVVDDVNDTTDDDDGGAAPPTGNEMVSRAELDKVIRERQQAKKKYRDAAAEIEKMRQATEGDSERVTREAREAALAEADKRYKPLIIATSAKAELVAAGVKQDKVARLAKLLDLGEIEVEDDGSVSGLAEQVAELKDEWPELFDDKPARRATSRAADGAAKPPEKKKATVEDILAARLRGER